MTVRRGLLVGLSRCGVSRCCVTPGRSGDHWANSSLVGAMRASLHFLVALLCSTYGAFLIACIFFFRVSTLPPPFVFVIHYLPSRFSNVLPVQCDGCRGCGWVLAGGASGWVAGRAGS